MKKIHFIEIGSSYQLTREYVTVTKIRPLYDIFFRFTILKTDGTLILKKGFAWDGATGAFDTKTILRGSAEHDAKYELMRQGLLDLQYRKIADTELAETCLTDGMLRFRVGYIYEAVEHLAADAANPKNKRVEKSAP